MSCVWFLWISFIRYALYIIRSQFGLYDIGGLFCFSTKADKKTWLYKTTNATESNLKIQHTATEALHLRIYHYVHQVETSAY